jgi:alanine-glyoxylate transaminase/serine-glyoxylate transaminase/serine-pyruvate transaminase
MIPGPAALPADGREILGGPVLAHYGEVWPALHADVVAAVGAVLGCREPHLIPGSGSAALDAAVFNLFEPGQRVVVPMTGYFGARLADIARAHGLAVLEVPVEVGAPVSPERVADALPGAHGLLCVHVETSTGVRHPVEALAAGTDLVVVVDAVASAGGERLAVDRLGADAVVTAGQKGLDGPPGLGVVALSERGRDRVASRSWDCPSWYLDLRRWERHRREDSWEPHPVTMPTTALLALLAGVRGILRSGLAARVAHRAALAARLRDGLAGLGLPPVPRPGVAANLVVAAWADDPDAVAARAARAGLLIARGLGPTAGRAVRVGLLGRTATDAMVDRLLTALAG